MQHDYICHDCGVTGTITASDAYAAIHAAQIDHDRRSDGCDGATSRIYPMTDYRIICGDSLIELLRLDSDSIDSCVTDPPYELGFMGKSWDKSGIAYDPNLWRKILHALKPGAHLLAFGGTRTYHRMACAIEDAGFEIRDQIQWLYGQGFPKSLDVSKAIDKMHGAERGRIPNPLANKQTRSIGTTTFGDYDRVMTLSPIPATDEAKQWNGWGTALKPANEPICLARKPLEKGLTVAQNVLKWGTGAINIDGCRVEWDETSLASDTNRRQGKMTDIRGGNLLNGKPGDAFKHPISPSGRFPANVIHDGSDEVEAEFAKAGNDRGGGFPTQRHVPKTDQIYGLGFGNHCPDGPRDMGSGSASRFFYTAKASQADRNHGLDGFEERREADRVKDDGPGGDNPRNRSNRSNRNHHPTVKPVSLMQYLCRLITPPGGLILDPFLGSGSTAKAALIERFRIIGIELDEEYCRIAEARCKELQVKLFT